MQFSVPIFISNKAWHARVRPVLIQHSLWKPLFVSHPTKLKQWLYTIQTTPLRGRSCHSAKCSVLGQHPFTSPLYKTPSNASGWWGVTVSSWEQAVQGVHSPRGLSPKSEGNFSGLLMLRWALTMGSHLLSIFMGSWLHWGVPRSSV